ncbi:hypothetical protein LP422_11880 [Janibacter limosus]|uniref:Uncharacterized protein n=1 Tax=Janibacter limosus TaxID=53458 RepID=A0AC61U0V0_9MICO|nr:hypothetical protein [Janibacter limosus]UUZ43635.1 hypothetical protein LP422_11880 [Janibacter limosus]
MGAFVRAVLAGWTPEGDDATIVLRSRELLHGQFPLQGMRSTAGGSDAALANHHPGPLELHILMPASIIGSGWVIALTCVAVAAVCSVATVHWAHRIGGDPAVVVFGAGLLVVQAALGPEALFRPFNPYFGLLPIYRRSSSPAACVAGLPGTGWPLVVTTAVVAQANLAYAPIGLGIAAAALAVAGWRALRERRPARSTLDASPGPVPPVARSHVGPGSVPGSCGHRSSSSPCATTRAISCSWPRLPAPVSPPKASREPPARVGLFAPAPGGFRPIGLDLVYEPSWTIRVLGGLVPGLLAGSAVRWGAARRRRVATVPARVALLGAALLLVTVARLPVDGLASHYPASVIPIVVFARAAIARRAALHVRQLPRAFDRPVVMRLVPPAAALSLLLAVLAHPVSTVGSDPGRGASTLVLEASSEFRPGSSVTVSGRGYPASLSTTPAVALQLERAGFTTHYLYAWPTSEDAERFATVRAPADTVRVHLIGERHTRSHSPGGGSARSARSASRDGTRSPSTSECRPPGRCVERRPVPVAG